MTEDEKRKRNLEAVKRYQARNREKVKESQRNYRKNNYKKWVEFIKSLGYNKCEICGYDKCFAALDFHHVTNKRNGNKELTISKITIRAFTEKNKELLINELKNCILLCCNCHRELHYNESVYKGGNNDR